MRPHGLAQRGRREGLPPAALDAAHQASIQAEVFFTIGTSALVQPAASLPIYAQSAGAIVVEINPDETPLTSRVPYALQGPAGEVLPELVKQVWME